MRRLIFAPLAVLLTMAPALARDLPHRLHEEPYFEGGIQVQVIVSYIITEDECRQLIAAYRGRARGGQVSVHRPVNSETPGRGPWCVDNLDGRGVTFNNFFDWEKLPVPGRRRS